MDERINQILAEAKKAPKRSYSIYTHFSRLIYDLGLDWKSNERALKKLADILKV